jgi:tRNA C32,U32 (ribose-2'-O)-methylase TrmJ
VKPRAAAATEENLRRMLRRMQLDAKDTVLWLGILRQIAWKLRANE